MNTSEWALVIFTILNQIAAGAFLILTLVREYATRKNGEEQANLLTDRAFLALIGVVVVSTIASLFHLGNPIHAPLAVSHLESSWLSREILSDLIFAGLVVIYGVMQWWKLASPGLRRVIAWITVVVGLVFVYVMSRAYMLPTEPAWNTVFTPLSFYAATFMLGSLATGVAFAANFSRLQARNPGDSSPQSELMREATKGISVIAIVFLGVELITLPLYLSHLSMGGAAAQASIQLMVGSFNTVFILRLILGFVGAGILAVFLYQNAGAAGREKVLSYLVYGAFALVLVAEVLNRVLFYATHVRIGI